MTTAKRVMERRARARDLKRGLLKPAGSGQKPGSGNNPPRPSLPRTAAPYGLPKRAAAG